MRVSGLLVGAVGVAAGTVAAVSTYHATSAVQQRPVAAPYRAPAVVGRPLPAAPPRIEVSTAPCQAPARLVDDACVTKVVRKVVVPDLSPTASPTTAPAPARPGGSGTGGSAQPSPSPSPSPSPRPDDN